MFMERFWKKVDVRGPDDCWEWQAGKNERGYGHFWFEGRPQGAHRVSYILEHEEPDDMVLHTCDNPGCVNPNHLYEGSHSDNMGDMWNRTPPEQQQGEEHPQSRLTEQQVRKIKREHEPGKVSYRDLAQKYDVTHTAIGQIIRGEKWSHVEA